MVRHYSCRGCADGEDGASAGLRVCVRSFVGVVHTDFCGFPLLFEVAVAAAVPEFWDAFLGDVDRRLLYCSAKLLVVALRRASAHHFVVEFCCLEGAYVGLVVAGLVGRFVGRVRAVHVVLVRGGGDANPPFLRGLGDGQQEVFVVSARVGWDGQVVGRDIVQMVLVDFGGGVQCAACP